MSHESNALSRWTTTARRLVSESVGHSARKERLESNNRLLTNPTLLFALKRHGRTANDQNALITLPPGVLSQIFDAELCRTVALQLCHRLRCWALDSPDVWTTLIVLDARMTPCGAHELLQRSHSLPLQHVQLECQYGVYPPAAQLEALLKTIGAHLHRIRSLSLEHALPYRKVVPWPAAPLLERVDLRFLPPASGPMSAAVDLGAMFADAPQLACLTISRLEMSTLPEFSSPPSRSLFLRLRTLVIDGFPVIRKTEQLDDLLVGLPSLETFRGRVIGFGDHTPLAPAAFRSVSDNLRVIRVAKCRRPGNILSLCVALGGVRALVFDSGAFIEDGLLVKIVGMFPRITDVSLGRAVGDFKASPSMRSHAIRFLFNSASLFGWSHTGNIAGLWSTSVVAHLTSLSLHEFYWRPEFWSDVEMPSLTRVRIMLASCWDYRYLQVRCDSDYAESMFVSAYPATEVGRWVLPSLRTLHLSFCLSNVCSVEAWGNITKAACTCRTVSSLALSDVCGFVARYFKNSGNGSEGVRLKLTGVEIIDVDVFPYLRDLYSFFDDVIVSPLSEAEVGDGGPDVWQVTPHTPNDQLSVFQTPYIAGPAHLHPLHDRTR